MNNPLGRFCQIVALALCAFTLLNSRAGAGESLRPVGVAKVDITPDYPIRLNGYIGRNVEATNAVQHLFAKALAIGGDKEGAAILVTIDNCILPPRVREELVQRLQKKARINPDRVALCTSHT